MTIGKEAGKSFAYLVGVYLGDGCITDGPSGRPVFRLNTIDEDFAQAVKAAILDVYDPETDPYICKHEVKKSSKPNYALWCGSQRLCEALKAEAGGKTFPVSLEKWSDDEKKAFIVGLMDSEGFVAKQTNNHTGRAYYMGFKSCDSWVPELIKLMQSVGLKLGKRQIEAPYKPHYKAPTRFHIKMQSWVDSGMRFNIKRKQERVDRWAATEPYSERSVYPRKLTSETTRQNRASG